eukprot:6708930-Pyramimonas_sp.AAC.1
MDALPNSSFTRKHAATPGKEAGDSQKGLISNRILRITEEGIEIEGDSRHAELLARDWVSGKATCVDDAPRVKHTDSDAW